MKRIPEKFPYVYNISLGKFFGIKMFNNYTTISKFNSK